MFDSSPFFLEFFLASLPPVLASLAHTQFFFFFFLFSTLLRPFYSPLLRFFFLHPPGGSRPTDPTIFTAMYACVFVYTCTYSREGKGEREREKTTLWVMRELEEGKKRGGKKERKEPSGGGDLQYLSCSFFFSFKLVFRMVGLCKRGNGVFIYL